MKQQGGVKKNLKPKTPAPKQNPQTPAPKKPLTKQQQERQIDEQKWEEGEDENKKQLQQKIVLPEFTHYEYIDKAILNTNTKKQILTEPLLASLNFGQSLLIKELVPHGTSTEINERHIFVWFVFYERYANGSPALFVYTRMPPREIPYLKYRAYAKQKNFYQEYKMFARDIDFLNSFVL